MPKPLSFEALFAALTVLGTAACAKEGAKAEPAPQQVTETAPATPAVVAAPTAAEPAVAAAPEKADKDKLATPPPPVAPVASVAPGVEKKPGSLHNSNNPKAPVSCGAKAACGAGTCSDEMKK